MKFIEIKNDFIKHHNLKELLENQFLVSEKRKEVFRTNTASRGKDLAELFFPEDPEEYKVLFNNSNRRGTISLKNQGLSRKNLNLEKIEFEFDNKEVLFRSVSFSKFFDYRNRIVYKIEDFNHKPPSLDIEFRTHDFKCVLSYYNNHNYNSKSHDFRTEKPCGEYFSQYNTLLKIFELQNRETINALCDSLFLNQPFTLSNEVKEFYQLTKDEPMDTKALDILKGDIYNSMFKREIVKKAKMT